MASSTGHLLVVGCRGSSGKRGIETDIEVLAAFNRPALIADIAFKVVGTGVHESIEAVPEALKQQTEELVTGQNVVGLKIGALFSVELVEVISRFLKSRKDLPVIVDAEAIFKTGYPVQPGLTQAIREQILPKTTLLSATVPEAKLLLDDAGVKIEYPSNMQDVRDMARSLQSLGPDTVILKREIFDKESLRTTLFYVLCNKDAETIDETMHFNNPKGVTGISYALPAAIAANLVSGKNVVEAVHEAYSFVGSNPESEESFLI